MHISFDGPLGGLIGIALLAIIVATIVKVWRTSNRVRELVQWARLWGVHSGVTTSSQEPPDQLYLRPVDRGRPPGS